VKNYYLPRYFRSYWSATRPICKAYGMDVVSLDTATETSTFFDTCKKSEALFETFTHIGAITLAGRSTDMWYWVNSGRRANYALPFYPGQPDFAGSIEYCLSLAKAGNNFYFNDVPCWGGFELKFICQRIVNTLPSAGSGTNVGGNLPSGFTSGEIPI
jgi:hypothetical protein